MTSEQLEAARSERMRQNGAGTLTLEEARTWIEETGLCLFLPRRQFSTSVAPSFVEAIGGRRDPAPNPPQIAAAEELLVRLELDGVAVRLNLLGQPGEQPDFVVAGWVLPYVYALRGDRDWRRSPQLTGSRQVSPLAVQTYKLLEAAETNVTDLTHKLGREVTEAAVLRAITELWQQLRIIPVIDAPGKAARWQLLRTRFQKAIAEGASTSQVTAISVLASIYLQAVIAATMEEVEIFLSPLTARSKVREVLRGLVATRQVHTVTLGHSPHYYVAGTLPEFSGASLYSNMIPSTSYYLGHPEDEEEESPAVSVFSRPPAEPRPAAPVVEAVAEVVVAAVVEDEPEVVLVEATVVVAEEPETVEVAPVEEAPKPEAKKAAPAAPAVSLKASALKVVEKPVQRVAEKPRSHAPAAHAKAPAARKDEHRSHTAAKPAAHAAHGSQRPAASGTHKPKAAAHSAHPAAPARGGSKAPARPAGKPQWSAKPAAGRSSAKSGEGSARPLNGLRPKPAAGGTKSGSARPAAPAWKKDARPTGKPAARSAAPARSSARPAAKPAARPAGGHSARPAAGAKKTTSGKSFAGNARSGARTTQGARKRG